MPREERLLGPSRPGAPRTLHPGARPGPPPPPARGCTTHVGDHLDQEGLRAKYAAAGVALERIEPVDTIWRDGPLHAAVPEALHGSFDRLIASHVIEHLPDPAGFLASAAVLLREGGTVALAVPDHRYCFDYFRPASTTGDVLEALFAKRTRHPARALWDQRACAISMDGTTAWGQHPVSQPAFLTDLPGQEETRALFTAAPGAFEDCHAWRFTPAGFSLILLELGALDLCDWRIDRLNGPDGCEFFAMLRRGREDSDDRGRLAARRMELLRARVGEMGEQAGFAAWGQEYPVGICGVTPAALAGAQSLAARLSAQERRLAEVERVLGRLTRRLAPFAALWRRLRFLRPG